MVGKNLDLKKRIDWKSGVSEILGFALVMPVVILVICAVLSVAQVSSATEKLSYAAYAIGRAAVVSENSDYALARAETILSQMYSKNAGIVFRTYGSSSPMPYLDNNEACCEIVYLNGDNPAEWAKGDAIQITVYQYINPIAPFTAGIRSRSIPMIVENGFGSGGGSE